MNQHILVADIGGTNSRFQLWHYDAMPGLPADQQACSCLFEQRYASAAFDALDLILDQFLASAPRVPLDAIVIGAAGPVVHQQVQFTNLSWSVSLAQLQARFPSALVALLNDFTIAAYALDGLHAADCACLYVANNPNLSLKPGLQTNPLRLLVGAGTGLGVGLLQGYGADLAVIATEAGHVDFAPLDAFDGQLQAWLMGSWDHVSFERLVSGDGLVAIYQFLAQHAVFDPSQGPSAADVAGFAAQGDRMAEQAIHLFWGYYGQFIGNMTLCWPAFGGVYIAGGMAPKLVRWLKDSPFYDRLWQKGRMSSIVKNCSLHLIKTDELGLIGARNYAGYQLQRVTNNNQSIR